MHIRLEEIAKAMRSQALFHMSGLLLAAALTATPLAAEAPRFTSLVPADRTLQTAAEVMLEGEVTDAVKLIIDGTEVPLAEGSFRAGPYAVPEGQRAFVLSAESASGEKTQQLLRVVRDSRGPSITVSQPSRGVLGAAEVTVKGLAADPHLAEVRVDGRPATLDGARFEASLTRAGASFNWRWT